MSTGFFNSSLLEGPNNGTFKQAPNLIYQETHGFIALAVVFVPLCWLAVGLRLYVRTAIIKAVGVDDWAMLVTVFLFTILGALLCDIAVGVQRNAIPLGAGETPVSDNLAVLITIGYCIYSAAMISFKFSMGFFFLKIFVFRTGYIVAIWLNIMIPTLFGVANIIYTGIASCEVESLFFVGLGNCDGYNQSQGWLDIAEAWTVINAVSDIVFAVLAVLALVNSSLRRKNKIIAAVLCSLGSVGCLASCVRLGFFVVDFPRYSVLGESMMETMWTLIEPGMGIVAACLATLRPLFRQLADSATNTEGVHASIDSFKRQGSGSGKKRDELDLQAVEMIEQSMRHDDVEQQYPR